MSPVAALRSLSSALAWLALVATPGVTVAAAGGTPLGSLVLDGDVYATARSGDVLYFGGNFTEVATRRGHGIPVDATTAVAQDGRPMVAGGPILAVAPDGAGGFYVGGSFTYVGGVRRNHAAHLRSDGSLDPSWNPGPDGAVRAIDVAGGTVYLGGDFTVVGGLARNRAAAVDGVTGAVLTWDPDLDAPVFALKASGTIVYLGGAFSTANGGTARGRAAAVDATTGALTSWDPGPNDTVFAIAVSGTTVYLGGYFGTVNGTTTRNHAAAVDAAGTATSWNPNVDGTVLALAVSGSTVFLAGSFQTVGGSAHARAAAVSASTGAPLAWNLDLDAQGEALAVTGSTVYVGGYFAMAGGAARRRAAAFDATSGALSSWDPHANGAVHALGASGSTVLLGGDLTSANAGTARHRAAALDLTTGDLTAWNPDLDGDVTALAVSGSSVYLAGAFTHANGATVRNRAAAVDAAAGLLVAAWDPDVNGRVDAIALSGATVYLGGRFTRVNGPSGPLRSYLAAVDAASGAVTAWNPNVTSGASVNQGVKALALSATTLYVGGLFDHVGGAAGTVRSCAAAFDLAAGTLTSWNPDFNTSGLTDRVEALAVDGSTVYAGGFFTHVKTVSRAYAVALDATSGVPTAWNPGVDNEVRSIDVSGSLVFLGGHFGTVKGVPQPAVAAVSAATGGRTSWNPEVAGYGPRSIDADCAGGRLILGGLFTDVGPVPQRGIAALTSFTCPLPNDPPVGAPQAIATDEDLAVAATLGGSDANGDALTFAVATPPAKGTLSGAGASRTYTPSPDANGTDTFTFTVSDGSATSAPATVTITIAPVNDAPALQPVGDKAATAGATLSFALTATDVDGDALTFSATGLPAGATLDPASGALSWTPAANQIGDHTVTFGVSDGLLGDAEAVTISVVAAATPPEEPSGGCGCGGGDAGMASLLAAWLGLRRRARGSTVAAAPRASSTPYGMLDIAVDASRQRCPPRGKVTGPQKHEPPFA